MATTQQCKGLCPVTAAQMTVAQKLVAGKWKFVILWRLSDGMKRFSELQKQLPNISHGILTQQLRELERDGIIHREIYKVVPPKVEYSLTDIGKSFIPILDNVLEWVKIYNKNKEKSEMLDDTAVDIPREISSTTVDDAGICQCGNSCSCGDSCSCND